MNSTPCCSVCFRAFLFTAPPRKPLSPVRVSTLKSRHNLSSNTKRDAPHTAGRPFLVEVTGLEPTTSWSLTKRATKLRYTSMKSISYYINNSRRVKRFFTPMCKKFAQITKNQLFCPAQKTRHLTCKKETSRRTCKPGSVERGHLSTLTVADKLKRYSRLYSGGQPI